jgi:voltage-gated potassium channel
MMIVLLISGTCFYAIHEGWSIVDALYFCVTTMSTVGFGDLSLTTNISKTFTIMYSLVSFGVFVGVASKLANAMITRSRHLSTK